MDDHDRRRAAISAVLAYAAQHPRDGLPYEQLPDVVAIFDSPVELVRALQEHWSQGLWTRIALLTAEHRAHGRRAGRSHAPDARTLARAAWSDCAARRPVLRRLLDSCHEPESVHSAGT